MSTKLWGVSCCTALVFVLIPASRATTIPRLTFENLTDTSELIVSGRVTQSWAAWDSKHKYIWTHYLLSVRETAKGAPASSVEFAEPGGSLADAAMTIAGTVTYSVGERVVVFLSRMPNGYLRTTGWAQGKYGLDDNGRVHGFAAIGAETIDADRAPAGVSLRTLEGMSFTELKQRVTARLHPAPQHTPPGGAR
jgi:hypothetical protein